MPGRNESFSANDLLLIDHVTPKRKTVNGRYCRHALELPFHIDIPLYLALIIWYPYDFIYVKTLKFLHGRPECYLQSNQVVSDYSLLMHLVMNIRYSDGTLHEACSAFTSCYYCNTEKNVSANLYFPPPLFGNVNATFALE